MNKKRNKKLLPILLTLGLPLSMSITNASYGQAVEWDAEKGYHAEEWYDPSDWFDDDGSIDYEADGLDYDYNYGGNYWNTTPWHDQINYTEDLDLDYNYGNHYVWNEEEDTWQTEYGPYNEAYSYKMSFDDDNISSADSDSEQKSTDEKATKAKDAKPVKKLTGTLDGFKKMNLRYSGGFDVKHSIAKIKLDNGKTAVTDLGYSSLILDDLEKGDKITLFGNPGQINGQNVFVATELRPKDGEAIHLERALTFSEDQLMGKGNQTDTSDNSQNDNYTVLAGTVEDFKQKQLSDRDGKTTFLKLKLESGKSATVDLGEKTSLDDLSLKKGDHIRVEGPKKKVESRTVLLAKTISVAGETIKEG